tara:strand:+ start:11072 stop:11590 length:519 start_codon:yes stop_codon:yes gene_type:complete
MKAINKLVVITFFLFAISCGEKNPNKEAQKVLDNRQIFEHTTDVTDGNINQTFYVPIYSEIYNRTKENRVLLTATLSIRNTSETDTLYLSRVAYFNTEGTLVRQYLEQSIYLKPMETVDYVIDEKDDDGGTGANFLIDWYANRPIKPLFQAVMLGAVNNQAFSFTTEGINVK